MGFPFRVVLDIAYASLKSMVPLVGEAETVVRGLKKGADRQKYVIDAARLAPEFAELVAGHDIYDNEAYERALKNLNDAAYNLQKAFVPKAEAPVA